MLKKNKNLIKYIGDKLHSGHTSFTFHLFWIFGEELHDNAGQRFSQYVYKC